MNLAFQCSENVNYGLYSYTLDTIGKNEMQKQTMNSHTVNAIAQHLLESLTLLINCMGQVKHASV